MSNTESMADNNVTKGAKTALENKQLPARAVTYGIALEWMVLRTDLD